MYRMKKIPAEKKGANRHELAHAGQKKDKNYSQSKDIHEDRSERKRKQQRVVRPR